MKSSYRIVFERLAIAALVIGKLILIRSSEIVAIPYDASLYVGYARWGYWTSQELWKGHYPPGYPLFLEIVSWTGMPLRLFQEVSYLGAAYYLCIALAPSGRFRALRVALFGVLAFSPETIYFFPYVQTENLVVVCTLCAVASTLMLLRCRTVASFSLHGLIIGFCWAWILISRTETVLFAGILAIFSCLLLLGQFWQPAKRCLFGANDLGRRSYVVAALCLVVVPALATFAAQRVVGELNRSRLGVDGQSLLSGRAMLGLYDALLSIDADGGDIYLPIDNRVRELAYRESPTLALIGPAMEATREPAPRATPRGGVPPVDIPTSQFLWRISQAYGKTFPTSDLPQMQVFFDKAAGEIESAVRAGRLPGRHVYVATVDPRLGLWLPRLPAALLEVKNRLVGFPEAQVLLPLCDTPDAMSNAWDVVANRRAAMTCPAGGSKSTEAAYANPSRTRRGFVIKGVLVRLAELALLGLVVFVLASRGRPDRLAGLSDHVPGLLVMAIYILARAGFYGLLDACMWVVPSRYLFPAMPLVSACAVLLICMAGSRIPQILERMQLRRPIEDPS